MINLNNKKHLYISASITGILPITYLMCNPILKKENRKPNKAFSIKLLGYTFSILTYSLLIILGQKFVIETGLYTNKTIGIIITFTIFTLLQMFFSLLYLSICKKYFTDAFAFNDDTKNTNTLLHYGLNITISLGLTSYLFKYGPFLFAFSAFYAVACIYVFSHTKNYLKTNKHFFAVAGLFILTAITFPFTHFAFSHINSPFAKAIIYIAYYFAPLLMYTVFLLLSWDIFKNLLPKKWKLPKYYRFYFPFVITLASLIVAKGIYNFNNPKITPYNVVLANEANAMENFKIAFAADCHFSEITNRHFINSFVDKINAMNADAVFLVGDIFESKNQNKEMTYILNKLKELKSKHGTFAVEGNHENYNGTNNQTYFSKANIHLLSDTAILINDNIQVVGRLDRRNAKRKSDEAIEPLILPNLPTIVLDHQPPKTLKNNTLFDISLSGHTHNGQMTPLNLITNYIYELSWGNKKVGNTHYFVTCGAQGWGPQIKVGSRSEIIEINLSF